LSKTQETQSITPQEIVDAFEAETRTRQYKDVSYGYHDAGSMRREHGLRPFWKQLYKTSEAARIDTTADAVQYPGVVPDCLIHLRRDERELLKQDEPDLSGYPETRKHVLRWLAADDRALRR